MSDDKPRDTPQAPTPDDETQPVRAEGPPVDEPAAPTSTSSAPAPAAPTQRRGFRERLRRVRTSEGSRTFSLGALIASALAGVIVGGLGAAALHAVADDGPRDHGPWVERWDEHGPGFGDRDGMPGGPGFGGRDGFRGGPGFPGPVQPTTPPDDDDGSSS